MVETHSSSCEGNIPQTVVNGDVNVNILVDGLSLAVTIVLLTVLLVLGVVFRKTLARFFRKWMK